MAAGSFSTFRLRLGRLGQLFVEAGKNWSTDNVSNLAAAFSFYAILAMAPLLVLAVTVAGLYLGGELTARHRVVLYVTENVGPDAAKYVSDLLVAVSAQSKSSTGVLATVISLVITFFGASNLFLQLQLAVDRIWKETFTGHVVRTFFLTRLAAFLGVVVFGILFLCWLALDSWLSWVSAQAHSVPGWQWVSQFASLVFLTMVFVISFKALPKGKVSWEDAVLAAIVTSTGVTLGKFLLGLYFAHAGVAKAYGSAGALVLILLWVYYTAQIYFFGVELTCTYSKTFGSHRDDVPASQGP